MRCAVLKCGVGTNLVLLLQTRLIRLAARGRLVAIERQLTNSFSECDRKKEQRVKEQEVSKHEAKAARVRGGIERRAARGVGCLAHQRQLISA